MVSASNFVSVDKDTLVSSVSGFLPKVAVIPLCEDDDDVVDVLVSEGSRVREGDVIAKSRGICIHSSVPGTVQKIEKRQYSNSKFGLCAVISMGGSFSFLGKTQLRQEWKNYDSKTIGYLLKESGVQCTFSKNEPLFSHIKKIRTDSSDTLVLRLFDEDPSLITESFVSKHFLSQVLEGALIIKRAFGAKNFVIAYSQEDGLKDELENLVSKNAFSGETEVFTVGIDTKKYPAGTMHDIVCEVKKVSKNGTFSKLGKKDLFIDSTTAYNAYNAVVFGKPVVSNFIHVTGDCLNAAAVLNIRIGTTLRDIACQCGGFKRKLSKIVINGIVLGKAVSSLDIPVGLGVKSVEFIPQGQVNVVPSENCIRCGNCRKICPINLWPGNLYRIYNLELSGRASEKEKLYAEASVLCSECGLCNSVCPSRLPLSHAISLLKDSKND